MKMGAILRRRGQGQVFIFILGTGSNAKMEILEIIFSTKLFFYENFFVSESSETLDSRSKLEQTIFLSPNFQ